MPQNPEKKGTCQMQSSHSLSRLSVTFSDSHAVVDAGLLLPATLAEKLGLRDLIDEHVCLGSAPGSGNAGVKEMTTLAGIRPVVYSHVTPERPCRSSRRGPFLGPVKAGLGTEGR